MRAKRILWVSLLPRAALLGFVLFLVLAGRSWAWGADGHRIVCEIAYLLLEPTEQEEVDRLVSLYPKPDGTKFTDFAEACTFPDVVRGLALDAAPGWAHYSYFSNWHFLNVPRDTRSVQESQCGENCVLKGIDYHSRRLADPGLEDRQRAEALIFLSHWIGDIHQPFHVAYADDRGGNEINPVRGRYYPKTNLHAIWDGQIIQKALHRKPGGWRGYAARLKDGISPDLRSQWLAATPLQWAQESYALITTDEVDYCKWEPTPMGDLCSPEAHERRLKSDYQSRFQGDVETRLQQAGMRLAARIRTELGLS